MNKKKTGGGVPHILVLPGYAAWGYTREEALEALQDTAQAFLEVMMEHNDPLPKEAEEESKCLSTPGVCPPLLRGDYRGVVSPMEFDLP